MLALADPGYLSERFPDFQGVLPNRDPALATRQGTSLITGDMSRREIVQNYQSTVQLQLPASLRANVSYIGKYATRLPFDRQINRTSFAEIMRLGDLVFERVDLRPDIGVPVPCAGFTGPVLDALRPFPQHTGVTLHTNAIGKSRYDSLQTTIERQFSRGVAVLAAYTRDAVLDRRPGARDRRGRQRAQHRFPYREYAHLIARRVMPVRTLI